MVFHDSSKSPAHIVYNRYVWMQVRDVDLSDIKTEFLRLATLACPQPPKPYSFCDNGSYQPNNGCIEYSTGLFSRGSRPENVYDYNVFENGTKTFTRTPQPDDAHDHKIELYHSGVLIWGQRGSSSKSTSTPPSTNLSRIETARPGPGAILRVR